MRSKEAAFEVIYEDNHLIAVNKRGGILVQGDETGDEPLSELVKDYLRVKYNKPGNIFAGVIHRLDRPVSGLVLLAKTSKALERMNEQFRNREVTKTYLAIVNKKPDFVEDTLIHYLLKDTSRNVTSSHISEKKGSVRAELSYKLRFAINDSNILEVNPVTGRPHQIRSQLAAIGSPIAGDRKYGSHKDAVDRAIALHSFKLSFIHPVKKEPIEIKASLPDNQFWSKFKHMEF